MCVGDMISVTVYCVINQTKFVKGENFKGKNSWGKLTVS